MKLTSKTNLLVKKNRIKNEIKTGVTRTSNSTINIMNL